MNIGRSINVGYLRTATGKVAKKTSTAKEAITGKNAKGSIINAAGSSKVAKKTSTAKAAVTGKNAKGSIVEVAKPANGLSASEIEKLKGANGGKVVTKTSTAKEAITGKNAKGSIPMIQVVDAIEANGLSASEVEALKEKNADFDLTAKGEKVKLVGKEGDSVQADNLSANGLSTSEFEEELKGPNVGKVVTKESRLEGKQLTEVFDASGKSGIAFDGSIQDSIGLEVMFEDGSGFSTSYKNEEGKLVTKTSTAKAAVTGKNAKESIFENYAKEAAENAKGAKVGKVVTKTSTAKEAITGKNVKGSIPMNQVFNAAGPGLSASIKNSFGDLTYKNSKSKY